MMRLSENTVSSSVQAALATLPISARQKHCRTYHLLISEGFNRQVQLVRHCRQQGLDAGQQIMNRALQETGEISRGCHSQRRQSQSW